MILNFRLLYYLKIAALPGYKQIIKCAEQGITDQDFCAHKT